MFNETRRSVVLVRSFIVKEIRSYPLDETSGSSDTLHEVTLQPLNPLRSLTKSIKVNLTTLT